MLPPGTEWPRGPNNTALHFLGQIDLSDLPGTGIVDHRGNALSEFPRDGAVYFFADCSTYGLWEYPEAAHRVLYVPIEAIADSATLPPLGLLAHNSPDAAVMASTHSPYFPKLCPRPLVKLPHIPLSFLDASATDLPPGEIGRPQYTAAPWTGYELHEDWSGIKLFETGFPWRWLMLERLAIAIHTAGCDNKSWPTAVQETCVGWVERSAAKDPLEKIADNDKGEFVDWLRTLSARDDDVRYYAGLSLADGMSAAWPYIAFSGDLSDLPEEMIDTCRPYNRPSCQEHHKILGDAFSVQDEQLADDDNVLLLRLESDLALDFCWGDAGVFQITISKDDLVARNFDRTQLNVDIH